MMENCARNSNNIVDFLPDCKQCGQIPTQKESCPKCTKQQKFNIVIICFCVMTILVNALLVAILVSNSDKHRSLQDSIVLLQRQVSSMKRKYDGLPIQTNEDQDHLLMKTTDLFSLNDNPSILKNSRVKRKSPPTKRDKPKKKRRKKSSLLAIQYEGRGGKQNINDDRFAGIFHHWQLADWTQHKRSGRGVISTGQKEFLLNLLNGELTIKRKGIYFFYSQITLMGQPDQGYYVERLTSGTNKTIARCMLSFHNSSLKTDDGYTHYLSCSTMGIFEFNFNDRLRLRHTKRGGVMALFDSNSSYFGLIKLK